MPKVRVLFRRRTDVLILGGVATVGIFALVGLTSNIVVAVLLIVAWSLAFAIEGPVRQAFINGVIPSEQRATVLSMDNLMGSAGGVILQPALGRVADVNGYAVSYLVAAGVQALSVPFLVLARREHASSDFRSSAPRRTARLDDGSLVPGLIDAAGVKSDNRGRD